MPGPYHEGWKHLRVEGDQVAAKAYYPLARKVLGFTVQEAGRQGLLTHKYVHREEGVEIVGELIGGQPRVTIRVPEGAPRPERIHLDDFVVWARDVDRPDGIDDEFPQQILRPEWTTYFYSGSIAGYAAFPGDKNVYLNPFVEGLRHAGNVDWRASNGVRLSWYGPTSRYWCDPFVYSRVQYGQQVFMLGRVVIDLSTHSDTTSAGGALWVLGAAMDGNDLYVVQADLPVEPTSTTPVAANAYFTDPPFATTDVPHVLCRYALIPDPAAPYARIAAPDSREVLWSGTILRGVQPWFFAPDASTAHSFGLPPFTAPLAGPNIGASVPPPASSPTYRLDPTGPTTWGLSTGSISVPAEGTAAAAGDYDDDGTPLELLLTREVHPVVGAGFLGNVLYEHVFLELDDAKVELTTFERTELASVGILDRYDLMQRYLLFADIREGVLVFLRDEDSEALLGELGVRTRRSFEVWAGGQRVHEQEVAYDPAGFSAIYDTGLRRYYLGNAADDWRSFFRTVAVNPMHYFHNWTQVNFLSSLFRTGFYGCLAGYAFLARQPAAYFGAYRGASSTSPTPTFTPPPVATHCNVTPDHEKQDFDGRDVPLSGAAAKGYVVYSGHGGVHEGLDSLHYVTGSNLGTLTGVAGAQARYHPVWQLGMLPAGA